MAISIFFRPGSMTLEQYNEIMAKLEEAGQKSPPGRLFHAASGSGDKITVFDIWDSQDSFEEFGQTLMALMDRMEIDPGIPAISALNNVVRGANLKDGANQ